MIDPLDLIIDLIVADRKDTDHGLRAAVLYGASVFSEEQTHFGIPDEPTASEIIFESTRNTMEQQDITQIVEPNEDDEEFLVKWKGRSYLEVVWISNTDFKNRSY